MYTKQINDENLRASRQSRITAGARVVLEKEKLLEVLCGILKILNKNESSFCYKVPLQILAGTEIPSLTVGAFGDGTYKVNFGEVVKIRSRNGVVISTNVVVVAVDVLGNGEYSLETL